MRNTKIGDVFKVNISDHSKKFLQYIISDLTQLNSDVVRVFKNEYPINSNLALTDIVGGEVDFYVHCVTKLGIKQKHWELIGNISEVNPTDIQFRISGDYGDPDIRISNNWYTWRVNEELVHVGRLTEEFRKAEIGVIMPPASIVHRMKTGVNRLSYPTFE